MGKYQIKLYSPVQIECEMPYEPPWMLGDDYRCLTSSEKLLCKDKVAEGMHRCMTPEERKRGMMVRYQKNDAVKRKIISAVPDVEIKNGRLMAVLTCSCTEPLTVYEQDSLAGWWENECQNGYGRELRLTRIKTKQFGRIWVKLWYAESDWNIILEESESHGMSL